MVFCATYYQGGKLWRVKRKLLRERLTKAKTITQKIVNKFNLKSNFDSQGSYTGVDAFDKYEKPIQDADDL